jgi:hypothetical protein
VHSGVQLKSLFEFLKHFAMMGVGVLKLGEREKKRREREKEQKETERER